MIAKINQLRQHQGFQKYLKNTSWLFAEKILRMLVGLFVGIWIARYLGPEEFGLFSYAQSFVALFAVLATLGLDGIVVREFVKNENRSDALIGTAFWLKVMGAIAVLLMLALAVNFTSNDTFTNTLVFVIASATIFQSFNVIDFYFQSKVLSKYVVYANIVSLSISSLVKIILILNEAPLLAFAWVVLFDSIVLALGYIYFYLKNNLSFKIQHLKFNKSIAFDLLKDSWPLVLSSMVTMIYMKIDQIMIKEMIDTTAVGQYAAAVKLSEAWYFIPIIVSNSLFPAIINSKKINKQQYMDRLEKLYSLMILISLPVIIIFSFYAGFIIDLLFGKDYNSAASVLIIHIYASIFAFLFISSGKWYIAENLTTLALYRNILGAVLNIVLNYFFIKHYGIVGAAYATLISFFISGYLFDLILNRTREQFIIKTKAFTFMSLIRKTI